MMAKPHTTANHRRMIKMKTDPRKVWIARSLLAVLMVMGAGALTLFLQWGYWVDGTPAPAMPLSSGTVRAPNFALRDLDGVKRTLAGFRGRVVILSFWATWCLPCRNEILSMAGLHQHYKDYGLEVVAVSSDAQGAEVVQPFMTRFHLRFTTLLDATGQVTRLYGVTSLPTTYLLDREGRLVTVSIGGYDWAKADARALITSLLDPAQQAAMPRDAGAM
jgi:peroxiredoxin